MSAKFAEMTAVQLLNGLEVTEDQDQASDVLKSLQGVLSSLDIMYAESDARASEDQKQSRDVMANLQEAANQIVLKQDVNAAQALRAALRKTVEELEDVSASQQQTEKNS